MLHAEKGWKVTKDERERKDFQDNNGKKNNGIKIQRKTPGVLLNTFLCIAKREFKDK